MGSPEYDAVVVGAGPNGLAAAVEIAAHGRAVLVVEAAETIGGGARTEELTLPGFRHDVCSAVHPLGVGSPFLSSLPLAEHGLEWVHPAVPAAHPLDDMAAARLLPDLDATAAGLAGDAGRYRRLVGPIVRDWDRIASDVLGPVIHLPRSPVAMARFGLRAVRSAAVTRRRFDGPQASALLGGMAAHSNAPLEGSMTAGVGLVLMAAAHRQGWPLARGGSQAIVDALVSLLATHGGVVETGRTVTDLADLPAARATLLAVPAWDAGRIAAERLPSRYRRKLERFRRGPGVFKVDWALDGPIPWRDEACAAAGTVHLGGLFEEIAIAEREVARGDHPERPFVLLSQPTSFDTTRAPAGRHIAWGYTHVPNGSTVDMTDRIEAQIERFAPGFGERILARHTMGPSDLERRNPSYAGGDITAGALSPWQIIARPTLGFDPYRTPAGDVYLCSASTPPGAGVHGMCGYRAARSALRHSLR